MQEEFLFSGFGGQGVMFVGQLLAYAAMEEGFQVTWIPSYGPEMRGGTAHCFVVISHQPIGSPVVRYPGNVIVFNNPSLDKYERIAAPGGLLAVNSSLVTRQTTRADIRPLYVPASAIADELGEMKLTNMVMLGAVLAAQPVLALAAVKKSLAEHLPVHRQHLLAANYAALEKGADFVEAVLHL